MLKVYTDLEKLKGNGSLYIDIIFNREMSTDLLSEKSIEYLKKHEKATIVGRNILDGRFGVFSIDNISTSVKILLYTQTLLEGKLKKPDWINISECGTSVFIDLIPIIQKLNIPVFFRNTDVNAYNADFPFILNDSIIGETVEDLNDSLIEIITNEIL